ncbi:MAG: GNAT family N-acetyltransferase [Clostridia bacterium]|nr:GNAT family N-acetyltransferase [Clostridia bacterium]
METKDLIIRESTFEDIDYFDRWEKDPRVTQFFSIADDQTRDDVVRKFVHDDEDEAQRQYTICLKDGKPIGRIVMGDIIMGWKCEIWRIYIGEVDLRGKGYGKQAMLAMMDLAFNQWNMARLYLDHYTGNPASFLYLSLGFKYEGVLRDNCRKNGKLYDVHLMSMLRDEYFEKYGK